MANTAIHPGVITGLAFLLAFVFGAVAYRVSFCTMGAITDIVNFGDWRRMRMWLLAIAVAIAGTAALQSAGLIDTAKTIYTNGKVAWASHLIGGFLFGFGMTLASGCGSKTLIRAGAGNLKSVIVLMFLAASAYMTLKGVFAPWRANGLDTIRWDLHAATSDLPALAMSAGMSAVARLWPLPVSSPDRASGTRRSDRSHPACRSAGSAPRTCRQASSKVFQRPAHSTPSDAGT